MREHEVEEKLRRALEHAAPDRVEAVLERCGRQTGEPIHFPPFTARRRRWVPWAAAACLALVVIGGIAGLRYRQYATVTSVVSLDVNPSVELRLNREERVLEALPRSSDAVEILGDMELEGTDLDVAVNAILGSLLKHGYVDELANSVLVSVEDADLSRGAALEARLTEEIAQVLEAASVDGAILSQSFSGDDELREKAEAYGISQGKAALIQTLVENSDHLSFETLVGLSINELNLLANSTAVREENGESVTPAEREENLSSTGAASQSAYIGAEAAKAAALAHAGVADSQVTFLEADYDYEDGRMVYEIEFTAGAVRYEYDVDAATGGILKYEREGEGASPSGTGETPSGGGASSVIGNTAARDAALAHAGVTLGQVTELEVEAELDEDVPCYKVEFSVGEAEYEYEIDAVTGGVLDFEWDT